MNIKGKEEILTYLEQRAKDQTGGTDGDYSLDIDEQSGKLTLMIAGYVFSQTGVPTFAGGREGVLTTQGGVFVPR